MGQPLYILLALIILNAEGRGLMRLTWENTHSEVPRPSVIEVLCSPSCSRWVRNFTPWYFWAPVTTIDQIQLNAIAYCITDRFGCPSPWAHHGYLRAFIAHNFHHNLSRCNFDIELFNITHVTSLNVRFQTTRNKWRTGENDRGSR